LIAQSEVELLSALADREHPKTYNEIFTTMEHGQEVLVTGEEDNAAPSR
jgi:hypothetical protein